MSVKNAFRILVGRFGVVWGILLFLVVYSIILTSISLIFLLPIIRALRDSGALTKITSLYDSFLNGTLSLNEASYRINEAKDLLKQVYAGDLKLKVNAFLLLTLVFVLINRFVLGYYELPALEVLHHKMAYNAKVGFLGRFISSFKHSTLYALVKIIYTILADAVIILILFGIYHLMISSKVLVVFLPFVMILFFIVLQALRYSVIACWAPQIVVDKKGIFKAFKHSTKSFAMYFSRIFGGFIIAWLFIFVFNLLFAILTMGAALVFTIPASMGFICTLNMTIYYANTKRRYYITDENIQKAQVVQDDTVQ